MKKYIFLLLTIVVLSCTKQELTIKVQIEAENQDLLDQTVTSVVARAKNIGNVLSDSIEKKANGQFLLQLKIEIEDKEVSEQWIKSILETKGDLRLSKISDFPWENPLSKYNYSLSPESIDSSNKDWSGGTIFPIIDSYEQPLSSALASDADHWFGGTVFHINDRHGSLFAALASDADHVNKIINHKNRFKFIPPSIKFLFDYKRFTGLDKRIGYYSDWGETSYNIAERFDQDIYDKVANQAMKDKIKQSTSDFPQRWKQSLTYNGNRNSDIDIDVSSPELLLDSIYKLGQESSNSFFDSPIRLSVGPDLRLLYPIEDGGITNVHISNAHYSHDIYYSGHYLLDIIMNDEGAEKWRHMTREAIGKRIAMIVDDKVLSAPSVMEEITSGRTQISGLDETRAKLLSCIITNPYSADVKVIESGISNN